MPILTATSTPEGYEPPQRNFNPFPDGSKFKAEVVEIKEDLSPWINKNTGEKDPILKFQFKVIEGRWANRRFFGDTKAEFFPGSKLHFWVSALFDAEVQPGFTLNTDDLIGKKGRITVGYRTWDKQDGSTGWSNDVKYLDTYDPNEVLTDPEEMADPNEGSSSSGGGTTLSYDVSEPF